MVNEKQTKRERNIRSKLMAAIAMLLVSSIMMVSTTYAWFTLSTAPEVTGITTSVASNGNLEIALSPASGVGTDVADATTQTQGWLQKNLTWGNLLDLSDASYGLASLTLAPAELAATGDATNGYVLNAGAALATPSYGSDGRISELKADAAIASKSGTGYAALTGDETFTYGIRAIGTSSGQSEQQKNFKTNVNAIITYANAAISAASNSLSQNGNALASMLVQHAEAGESDANNYAIHVPALVQLTSDLKSASTNIENALKAAVLASVSTLAEKTADGATLYTTVYNTLKSAATLNEMETILTQNNITMPTEYNTIKTKLATLQGKIDDAYADAQALLAIVDTDEDGKVDGTTATVDDKEVFTPTATVTWSNAGEVLTALMNTSGTIKVSGYTISQIKEKMNDMTFLLGLATNCQIELGAGSGVYYDMAELTGNIQAKTTATVTARGMTVTLDNVIIKTTYSANVSLLPVLKTYLNDTVTPTGGASVVDAFYGYVIDLMVRTNAADSYLKLQTTAAQRVYADSASEATMGGGSTFIFKTTDADDVASINDLCKSIRVVFFDPTNDANTIFGLAKVTTVVISEAATGVTLENGDAEIEYTITGSLELCQMTADANNTGLYIAGDVLTAENSTEPTKLCALTQNVPQAISAMVYLDGNDVTSSDVLADENVVGMLNLQFASSATLNPMMNSDLFNATEPTT